MGRIVVAGGTHLSAVVDEPTSCGPLSDCFVPHALWVSDDGGVTWRDATP